MTVSVVYLAYYNKNYGYTINVVERFLKSYEENPAGMEHDLVLVAKNWTDKFEYEKLKHLAKKFNARIIELPDDGLDFGAYFRVAKLLDSDYIFFLGSYIDILRPDWLSAHYKAFKNDKNAGIVGAMGSWGETQHLKFPCHHIRTCCFMMPRELFVEYADATPFPVTKEDTYEMEHGKHSITDFVLNKGKKALVVNSNEDVFEPDYWVFADTFRSPNENKSFFSDRQSLYYYSVEDDEKEFLERAAWGRSLKNTDAKIFVSYHKGDTPLVQSTIYQPILNGANKTKNAYRVLKDNMGENISDKHESWGELTGHYFLWKNILPTLSAKYVGFCHYRRFLDFDLNVKVPNTFAERLVIEFQKMFDNYSDDNIMNIIKDYDIIIPNYSVTTEPLHKTISDELSISEIEIIKSVLKEYPEHRECGKNIENVQTFCLVFVMKKNLLQEYLAWSFGILEKLETKIEPSERKFAIIAEKLFAIWLDCNAQKLKIKKTSSIFVEFDVDAYMKKYMALIEQAKKL